MLCHTPHTFTGKTHIGGLGWPGSHEERAALRRAPANGTVTASLRHVWDAILSRPVSHAPTAFGFDEFYGLDVNNGDLLIDGNTTELPLPDHWTTPSDGHGFGPTPSTWDIEGVLPRLTKRAAAFVHASVRVHQLPFLLYLASTSPHAPLAVSAEWRHRSQLSAYADWVMQSDAVVGELTRAIEEEGASHNTLLIVSSDNGQLGTREPTSLAPPAELLAVHHHGHLVNGLLRGGKSDAFEGGHRVPFIVRWPAAVPAGQLCSALVHHTDLLATLADILQEPLPDDAGEDSMSMYSTLLSGDAAPPVRRYAVSCSMRNVPTLRDGPWKLILGRGSGGWTLAHDSKLPEALYNLETDREERFDLAANESARVARMRAVLLDEIVARGRSVPHRTPLVSHSAELTTLHPVACRRPKHCIEWRRGVISS